MYAYNLLIKCGGLDDEAAVRNMVNSTLTTKFGPDVHYNITAILSNEVVVIVRDESKRNLQATLGQWFTDTNGEAPFIIGTLLHYREITPDEPIYNQLGG